MSGTQDVEGHEDIGWSICTFYMVQDKDVPNKAYDWDNKVVKADEQNNSEWRSIVFRCDVCEKNLPFNRELDTHVIQ